MCWLYITFADKHDPSLRFLFEQLSDTVDAQYEAFVEFWIIVLFGFSMCFSIGPNRLQQSALISHTRRLCEQQDLLSQNRENGFAELIRHCGPRQH